MNFLTSEKITQICNEKIRKSYESLASYLDYTFDGNTKFITIDLGFNGTICNNLEGVFSKSPNNYKITHLLAFGSDHLTDLKKKNIDIRSFFTSPRKPRSPETNTKVVFPNRAVIYYWRNR